MSSQNPINNIIRVGDQTFGNDDYYEMRIENESNGNPIYVGRSPITNADPGDTVWFITKMYYDVNDHLERVQQPDDGQGFKYEWDERATYFS